ncbi:MAG: rhomboid family intramembrane serine protease [Bacteroidetes bacterium]|nr:rhomboid family intramembrane serine protease [Bacteroidota bacterium]
MSVNIIIIFSIAAVSFLGFSNQTLFLKFLFKPYSILKDKEWYRFISSAWLHADYMHLFVNLFVLYSFGNYLEYFLNVYYEEQSSVLYLFLFLGSTVVSHIPSYVKHKSNINYQAVGASGGVSGILFAYILINPLSMLELYLFIPIPAIVFGILYLWYSYYMSKKNMDNIGHEAHIYGALGGMTLITIIKPGIWVSFFNQLFKILG